MSCKAAADRMNFLDGFVMDTILDNIGYTPLVRVNKITKDEGIECELLAKCEYFNAGGSVKDRIGKRMIEDAETSGRIKKGDTLIEPTSGNTGIGMALSAALKGYNMVITLPEKMSQEKVDVLKGLGATIIRTPTEAAYDSPESHIGVAKRLNHEIPNSHILDQYTNMSNPLAHYDGTGEEIFRQTQGKLDVAVISAGTGGTITGIAKKLKEKIPGIRVIGVDPHGSILAQPESLNTILGSYKVEGIGYDFIPDVLERQYVDEWFKTADPESFTMARRLIHDEGLLCGGSSGSAMVAAVHYAKQLKKGQRLVVVLPDSVRNYMSKFLNDDWMIDNGFIQPKEEKQWWHELCVGQLTLTTPTTIKPHVTVEQAIKILNDQGFDQLPVVSENGDMLGVVSEGNLIGKIASGRVKKSSPVTEVMFKQFRQVSPRTSLRDLSRIFDKDHFALVVQTQKCFSDVNTSVENKVVVGVATRIDLINFIMAKAD
eukprot:TRINITY_DN1687_c0_g1::TRINITY_DN1687_c0_g1_i1::g.17742::m.17742 TRINITY_DN1687_c0_g1::TRINITY_DN1687_c0_g1_i1::g.17742  ORF type:complete len:508 (+),score=241.25,sp/Q91WT9/CBS_MOUSE/59.47/0.0,PALP/PF00291.20/1.8e-56,CBS/PF00571.23/1.4e-08,CBS/PF00571.23/0.0029,HAD/PF12710.2/0.32 TRINITY_DN1687_c0_g1_i1:69-1526(+)